MLFRLGGCLAINVPCKGLDLLLPQTPLRVTGFGLEQLSDDHITVFAVVIPDGRHFIGAETGRRILGWGFRNLDQEASGRREFQHLKGLAESSRTINCTGPMWNLCYRSNRVTWLWFHSSSSTLKSMIPSYDARIRLN